MSDIEARLETTDRLRAIIDALTPFQLIILWLVDRGYSMAEIAALMEIPPSVLGQTMAEIRVTAKRIDAGQMILIFGGGT